MAWNQIAKMGSQEMHRTLNFLQVVQAMDAPTFSLHCSQELLSTATLFKPCNMLLLFCRREREGRWRRGCWLGEVIKAKECGPKTEVKLQNPRAPWLLVFFNIWYHICQAMDESHVELAEGQKAGTDDEHMQSKSCSFSLNTTPAYPSNTPPKGPTLMMICT